MHSDCSIWFIRSYWRGANLSTLAYWQKPRVEFCLTVIVPCDGTYTPWNQPPIEKHRLVANTSLTTSANNRPQFVEKTQWRVCCYRMGASWKGKLQHFSCCIIGFPTLTMMTHELHRERSWLHIYWTTCLRNVDIRRTFWWTGRKTHIKVVRQ